MKRSDPMRALFLLAALASVAAPLSAQAKPKPIDPVGDFEYSTTANGQTVSGVLSVVKKDNALSGKITSDAFPEFAITAVKVEEMKVTLTATLPDDGGQLTIVLTFEDNNKFAGQWTSSAGDSGAISGKRKTG